MSTNMNTGLDRDSIGMTSHTNPTALLSTSLSSSTSVDTRKDLEPPTSWEDSVTDEKRCWICFVEEGEEKESASLTSSLGMKAGTIQSTATASSSNSTSGGGKRRWVRACKCRNSLKYAHEHCLLLWITSRSSSSFSPVSCPACGYTYQLIEPRSPLFTFVTTLCKCVEAVIPYATLTCAGVGLYVVGTTYGAYVVMTMCGVEDGERVLAGEWGWRVWMGLPLIPLSLLLSRVSLGDGILPLLPFLVLRSENIRLSLPPTPALSLCVLPWIRCAYNSLWKRMGAGMERWLAGEDARTRSGEGNGGEDEEAVEEGDGMLTGRDGQRVVLGGLLFPGKSFLSLFC
ncbi:hypothetical protein BC832DRAFT_53671 [Gaertneriomyces semiglobifer]|nr:hypothetical protein BC832DRAFT_53671 [Gaertneriomyces semiglobifer]